MYSDSTRENIGTYSIVAHDPDDGQWGVGVASRFLASGWIVPWARAGVGAVATQARANPAFGPRALEHLAEGCQAANVLRQLLDADDHPAGRQVALVDATGVPAAHTGGECQPWAGHLVDDGVSCQGNILARSEVLDEMMAAYRDAKGQLADRMLAGLHAAEHAGGDRRGRQSAALLVVEVGGGYGGLDDRFSDLRVDDHPEPLGELNRVWELFKRTFHKTTRVDHIPWNEEREALVLRMLTSAGFFDDRWPDSTRELRGVLRAFAVQHGIEDAEVDSGLDGRLWRLLGGWR